MKLQTGELLISSDGRYYRIVERSEASISLVRVDGYTLFSCHPRFVEACFRPATSPAAI